MATCSAIINRALRKIGRLGAGRDARTNDAQDALDVLRGMYVSWISSGAFGRLSDAIAVGDVTAHGNQRIIREVDSDATITLPLYVSSVPPYYLPPYGALWPWVIANNANNINYNVKPPRDFSPVVIIDQNTGTSQTWVYDGSLKLWASIDGMTLESNAPLSDADPDGLAAELAVQIADQFAGEVSPVTISAASRFRQMLTHRYSTPRVEAYGVYV